MGRKRRRVARHYKVTLETPEGVVYFECSGDTFVLVEGEENELELPWACRTGECSVCTGKVLEGTIDQSEQTFLTEEQISEGYCLTCVTKPTSDVRIRTHCDNDVGPVKVTEEELAFAMDLGFDDSDDEDDDDGDF